MIAALLHASWQLARDVWPRDAAAGLELHLAAIQVRDMLAPGPRVPTVPAQLDAAVLELQRCFDVAKGRMR